MSKKIAEKIVDKNAAYVLPVKDNHKNLHDDLKLFFQDSLKAGFKDIDYDFYETVDGEHGRIEIRKHQTTSDIDWLQGWENWKDIKMTGMVQRERRIGDSISNETAYYIGGIENDAKLFGKTIRSHRSIENSLHRLSDFTFREDESRIRKENAPENFAVLRHIALNILKSGKSKKMSVKRKRLKAGWDNKYLFELLQGVA